MHLSSAGKQRLSTVEPDSCVMPMISSLVCARGVEPPMRVLRSVLKRLGLSLNEAKTRVVDAREQSFDFLGFSFHLRPEWPQWQTLPACRAVEAFGAAYQRQYQAVDPSTADPGADAPDHRGAEPEPAGLEPLLSPPQLQSGTVQGEAARGRAGTYPSASAPQAPQPGAGVPALSRAGALRTLWTLQAADDGTLAHGACPGVKSIGKPCTGKPYARFDERGLATAATDGLLRHRQPKGAATDRPSLRSRDTWHLLDPLTPLPCLIRKN